MDQHILSILLTGQDSECPLSHRHILQRHPTRAQHPSRHTPRTIPLVARHLRIHHLGPIAGIAALVLIRLLALSRTVALAVSLVPLVVALDYNSNNKQSTKWHQPHQIKARSCRHTLHRTVKTMHNTTSEQQSHMTHRYYAYNLRHRHGYGAWG